MRDLDACVLECKKVLDELKIPYRKFHYSYNGRIRNKWGYCRKVLDEFQIEIAIRLSETDVPKKTLLSVLYHEILHTCPGCFNHGKNWKEYGKLIKKKTGIQIYETSSADDMKVDSHYYVKCRKCKMKIWQPMKPRNDHKPCPYCGSHKTSCFFKEKGKEKIRIWKNGKES